MRKKTPRFLRSLSVLLSAAVLAGSFTPAVQTVSAQSTDIDFISSDEEVTSSDTDISLEDIDENTDASAEAAPDTDIPDISQDSSGTSIENESPASSQTEDEDTFTSGDSDETAENLDYILGRPMTEEERQAQLAPMQTLTTFTPEEEVNSDFSVSLCDIFPESYDSREQNLITSVKNQNPFGICWAFSLLSTAKTPQMTILSTRPIIITVEMA